MRRIYKTLDDIKTDGDVVRIARMMDTHILLLQDLAWAIRDSDHPKAEQIFDRLEDNTLPPLA